MKDAHELRPEDPALRARLLRLNEATLRVHASLDLSTVLQEVLDGARALTSARYAAITTTDETGQVLESVASGFTPGGPRRLVARADGERPFEQLRHRMGMPAGAALQAAPMHHRGAHVGDVFIGDKHGGEAFTREDEEVLLLFASQAAAAIANARTYGDERRARADVEARIETAPVGVVVFDARTNGPVSLNQESRRIVEGLRGPEQPVDDLLKTVTCRRSDGRQVSLAELPQTQQSSGGETVRAEEMTLSVPGGRRVEVLVNATPVRTAAGGVDSVVVTLQDLAPLEELDRLRGDFLSMVSHELRAPLTSIKGSAATVLGASQPPDLSEVVQFFRIIDQQADHMRSLINDLMDAERIETGTLSIAPEPVAVAALVDQARNTFLSGGGRHAVRLELPPDLPRVLVDRQRIVQVLNNLFSNAARHSPASSPIRIAALADGDHVAVSVTDGGRGVPPERLPHLFRKHAVGTRGDRKDGAQRSGLGLSICKGLVEAHGGRIWAENGRENQGTRFTFTIPVARAAATLAPNGSRPPTRG